MLRKLSLSLVMATAVTAITSTRIAAQDCPEPRRQATQITTIDGAFLVLKKSSDDSNPFFLEDDCVTIPSNFWPKGRRTRFLYLGVVNFVPSEEEPEVGFLGIQIARPNPRRDGSDLVRIYRNADWVRQSDKGVQRLRKIPGLVAEVNVSEWSKLHSGHDVSLLDVDARMRAQWHAQPTEDVPSSWDLRAEWSTPASFKDGTILTNLLVKFTTNRDQRVSIVPFQIGLPADTQELFVGVHSNIDAIKKTVSFRFSR